MKTQIACQLWHQLWEVYRDRVSYAQVYEQLIKEAGGTVANDHIAFRSLRLTVDTPEGKQDLGISYLEKLVEALGYSAAGEYTFPEQHLYARHYRHPEQDLFDLPKLFISELIVEDLPETIAQLIEETVRTGLQLNDILSLETQVEAASADTEQVVNQLQSVFIRPWSPPRKSAVETVNSISQYGAWVLLHGYSPNHFTGYVNRQNTPQYPNIESTAHALVERGVPMKAEIEGTLEKGLRQTATQAVTEQVTVRDDVSDQLMSIPWTYAYYEIAERSFVEIYPGQKVLFEAFFGNQAQNLFEMTRTAEITESVDNSFKIL